MFEVSNELKQKLQQFNSVLRSKIPFNQLTRDSIRESLSDHGKFIKLNHWNTKTVEAFLEGSTIFGVDGSTNSTKGLQSRAVHLFQVLGKGISGVDLWLADVYTPLLKDELETKVERNSILTDLELTMARKIILEHQPKVILMDGSLLHFKVENQAKFSDMIRATEDNNVLIMGISEEIATNSLAKQILPKYSVLSDADILCGILDIGEAFVWDNTFFEEDGLWRVAVRSAQNPQPIVIDGLLPQSNSTIDMLDLVYSLTPAQGRGIPLWLDIVDQQVRITDRLLDGLLDNFIDSDIRRRLLMAKRSERVI